MQKIGIKKNRKSLKVFNRNKRLKIKTLKKQLKKETNNE